MIFDTHAHLSFPDFEKDFDKILEKLKQEKIWVIIPGTDFKTSFEAVKIAEKEKQGVFAAIGLHPLSLTEENFDEKKYEELVKSKKVVAIGETGLDYYKLPKDGKEAKRLKIAQKDVFLKHLKLAKKFNLPLIIHCREAREDLLTMLLEVRGGLDSANLARRNWQGQGLRERPGVIHCFTGTWEEAKQYLDLGFYLGFTGIIFKFNLREVIEKISLDRILIETDSPYLIPPSARRSPDDQFERNEPIFVKYIAEEIARIKKISPEEVEKITFENAKKLFEIT